MSKIEFWKVVISSALLFFMLYSSLIFEMFEYSANEWVYIHYNWVSDKFELNTLTPWKEANRWFIQRVSVRTNLVILAIVWMINPDFKRWGIAIKSMWIFLFMLLVYSFGASYDTIPFVYKIYALVMSVQLFYTLHCYLIYKGYSLKEVLDAIKNRT